MLAALVAVSALAVAGQAQAATGGSLLFTRDHNVWLTSPDGATERPLTTDGTADAPYHSATQSADGTVVVAVRDSGTFPDIVSSLYEMDRQGTLLRVPFVPPQYELRFDGPEQPCPGYSVSPQGILAVVSPDGMKVAVEKRAHTELGDVCGPGSLNPTEVYILDGSTAGSSIVPDPPAGPTILGNPSWASDSQLLIDAGNSMVYYYNLGAARAARWFGQADIFDGKPYAYPALGAGTLATSYQYVELWTTDSAIPAAPTPRCYIQNPDHTAFFDKHWSVKSTTIAPDGSGVAWVEQVLDDFGAPTASDIYLSPVGDISAGDCSSIDRQLLIEGGSDPNWGSAAVGPAGPSTTLPVCPADHPGTPPACETVPAQCPAGQTGTPPDCHAPAPSCPAGQTGTPPDCHAPAPSCPAGETGTPPDCHAPVASCPASQTGTPPDCHAPMASCPAGQTGTPPDCHAPMASCPAGQTGTPPDCHAPVVGAHSRTLHLVVRHLRSGCSRTQLTVSGGGVTVIRAKRLGHSRCRLTLKVAAGATGRRNLIVRRGKRKTTLTGAIRL